MKKYDAEFVVTDSTSLWYEFINFAFYYSGMTKNEFFDFYRSQLNEPLYLTDKTTELQEEIHHNCRHIGIPHHLTNQVSTDEISKLITTVKDYYKRELDQCSFDIDLWFYLWFDEQAGHLRFNFINSNHEQLPFACPVRSVADQNQIIIEYFKSLNNDEDAFGSDEFILNVYAEILPKTNDN